MSVLSWARKLVVLNHKLFIQVVRPMRSLLPRLTEGTAWGV
jgi:hypothetical protein